MTIQVQTCHECKNPSAGELVQDKRYNHYMCVDCFSARRSEAARASDYEWFDANGLIESLTEDEKYQLGI